MANHPPFATLNHFAADLGIPSESKSSQVGITIPAAIANAIADAIGARVTDLPISPDKVWLARALG